MVVVVGAGELHGRGSLKYAKYARSVVLEPVQRSGSYLSPSKLQRALIGRSLKVGEALKVTMEDGGEQLDMKVQACFPFDSEPLRVGKRTQVLAVSEDFVGMDDVRRKLFQDRYCSARVLVDSAITHFLEKLMRSTLVHSFEQQDHISQRIPTVILGAPGGRSGLKELVLELSPVPVVCVNAGKVYAESVRSFNGRVDAALHATISKALVARPIVILFEDLHRLVPSEEAPEGEGHLVNRTADLLGRLLDNGGQKWHGLLVVGIVNNLKSVFLPLRRRLETSSASTILTSPVPAAHERALIISHVTSTILSSMTRRNSISISISSADGEEIRRKTAQWSNEFAGCSAVDTAVAAAARLKTLLIRDHAPKASDDNKDVGEEKKKEESSGGEKMMMWGHNDVLSTLKEIVVWPRRYSEIYRHFYPRSGAGNNDDIPHAGLVSGILLYGPPGTGKTLLARHIGSLLQCNLVSLSIPQVIKGEIGKGEEAVQVVVREARRLAPSVLFIDEFQAIFTAREGDRDTSSSTSGGGGGADVGQSLSSSLASAFDAINHWNSHAGASNSILVLGATNEPWAVDRGFLRRGRFDQALFIGPLDTQGRRSFLQAALRKFYKLHSKSEAKAETETETETEARAEAEAETERAKVVEEIVEQTELYSGADLQLLFRRAIQRAHSYEIEKEKEKEEERGGKEEGILAHMRWALHLSEPTSSQQDIMEYRRWAEEMKL